MRTGGGLYICVVELSGLETLQGRLTIDKPGHRNRQVISINTGIMGGRLVHLPGGFWVECPLSQDL